MFENRPVVYAKFHQALFIPGGGTLGDTLPSTNKTLIGLKMSYTPAGLFVQFGAHDALVPWPNVAVAKFGPPTKATESKAS